MTIIDTINRGTLVNAVALALLALAGTIGSATASAQECESCTPWWHVTTLSAPAKEAAGEGQVVVEATNLGDKVADGRIFPMTIVDTLPAGLKVTAVYGEGGGGQSGDLEEKQRTEETLGHSNCSVAGQTVTCVYLWPLMPYERLSVAMDVNVTPGAGTAMNEVTVSGGGSAAVVSDHPLAMESPAPSFGIQDYEIAPEEEGGALDTQAGSHPFQMTTTFLLNTGMVPVFNSKEEHVREVQPPTLTKDLRFELPPGMIGNPTALPKCSTFVFTQETKHIPGFKCPADTVVGVATSIVNRLPTGGAANVPGTLTEALYNLEPAAGEPARFGFATPSPVGVTIDTSVRTGGDYGVTVTTSDVTQLVAFIGSQVTFWGAPSDTRHDRQRGSECLAGIAGERYVNSGIEASCPLGEAEQPFLIMPTSCKGVPETSVEGDSWSEPGHFVRSEYQFPFHFDGCDALNFEPSISVAPDVEDSSTPTGLKVDVHVPQDASLNPTGLAESAVKRITVALPQGVAVNPSGADGLEACSEAQIALHSPNIPSCPDAAKLATVKIHTPLLPNQLEGSVYLATQNANPFGSLVAMYLVAQDPVSGVLVKLAGEVQLTESGQIISTFESPQLPFEDAEVHFFGGSRAPLTTPSLCGSYTTTALVAPWSANPPYGVLAHPFSIVAGPNGSPCSNPLAFSPSLTGGSMNLQAGAFTPLTTTISRPDGQQNLRDVRLHIPAGLSGVLTGVKLCGEEQANAGVCGPESLIGETTVSVGVGGSPFSVKGGKVYLTGPYEGAPFGLSIVNPAKAGPFDLEKGTPCDCVVVRAKIEVDPMTAALTVTTDSTGPYRIPTIIDGIPLQIQHANVTINRPGFTFNPTNCKPMAITGNVSSTLGSTRAVSVPFQIANCATLGFKPQFKVATSGKTSRKNGASIDVKLSYPKAPWGSLANIAKVKVDLPKQLPSRLSTLQKACPAAVFDENPAKCSKGSKVGSARAVTPIIPVPLEGPAYFVSHGGAKFPELIVVLQGYGVTVDLHGETFISKKSITSSTFRTVPDVPVGSFELKLPQGPNSALAANGNLCKIALKMPTVFTAQNGLQIHQATRISVSGCPKRAKGRVRKG